MAVGMMILAGISARFWARTVPGIMLTAMVIASTSSYAGLLVAFHWNLPAGPSVILVIGLVYLMSIVLGKHGGLLLAHATSRP